ncbi:MAG: flagellar FliJ family protein [Terriglobales bacterium]
MAFQFTLAAVLKYRRNLEHREYLALEKIHQEIVQVDLQIQQCEERRSEALRRREAETTRGIASIHLQDAYERERNLERQRDELQGKRHELKVKRQQCLKTYQLARQKREILEALRNRQLSAYVLEQSRHEQRQIDDLFLSRLKRGR